MTIFKLGCHVTVSAYTEIDADTLEDAMAEAADREMAIGGNGSGMDADEYWIVDDIDGAPENIHDESNEPFL